MSAAARRYFEAIVQRYLDSNSPERKDWLFDGGQVSDTHRELEADGLIERVFGAERGFAWRLTDTAVRAR